MAGAEGPEIFGVQCIWERIFAPTEKIFVFKYLQTTFHLVFTRKRYRKSATRTFLVAHTA